MTKIFIFLLLLQNCTKSWAEPGNKASCMQKVVALDYVVYTALCHHTWPPSRTCKENDTVQLYCYP